MEHKRFFEYVNQALQIIMLAAVVLFFSLPRINSPASKPLTTLQEAPAVLQVMAAEQGIFGNITVRNNQGLSLAHAYLLVNGQVAGSFISGSLSIRVYPGDKLEIDTTAYQRTLEFTCDILSSSINSDYLHTSVSSFAAIVNMGVVVFI